MPQPKKSRSSSSTAKRAPAKRATARRGTSAAKPAARGASTRRASAAAPAAADDALRSQLKSVREMLRRRVVLTRDHVQEALDEAVKRGHISRKDARQLGQSLMTAGRRQADDVRKDIEQLLGRGRTRATKAGDPVLRQVDRARRAAGVGSFPILNYENLTASQITSRLKDLTPAQLRKVRDYERRHGNRKSVLGALEKKLG